MTNKQNVIRDLILSMMFGVAVGNIIALISLWINTVSVITLDKWGVVTAISGLIGLVSSLIFRINDIPAKIAYPAHFISVFGLMITMNFLNGWADWETLHNHALSVFLQFLLIYISVWLVVVYLTHQKVSKINQKIKERKHQLNRLSGSE